MLRVFVGALVISTLSSIVHGDEKIELRLTVHRTDTVYDVASRCVSVYPT